MRFTSLLVLAATFILAGCATRQPVGTLHVSVHLPEDVYKEMVKAEGSTALEARSSTGMVIGSGGSGAFQSVGLSFPLSTTLQLIGKDQTDLDQTSFTQELDWGDHSYDIPVYASANTVFFTGRGPGGKISRLVGTLSSAGLTTAYTLTLEHAAVATAGTSPYVLNLQAAGTVTPAGK